MFPTTNQTSTPQTLLPNAALPSAVPTTTSLTPTGPASTQATFSAKPAIQNIQGIKTNYADAVQGIANQASQLSVANKERTALDDAQKKSDAIVAQKDKELALKYPAGTALQTAQPGTMSEADARAKFGQDFTGVHQNADGSYTADASALARVGSTAPGNAQTDLNAKNEEAYKKLTDTTEQFKNGTIPLTPAQQGQIDALKAQADSLRKQQQATNQNFQGGIQTLAQRSGRSQYAPELAMGEIQQAVSDGLSKVQELDAKAAGAIAQMTQAFQQNNYEMVRTQYDDYVKYADQKQEQIDKVAERTQKVVDKQNEIALKAEQSRIQATRDSAVADLMNQVGNDPSTLLQYLNFDDKGNTIGDFTADEIAKTIKNLTLDEKLAPGSVGQWQALRKTPGNENLSYQDFLSISDPGAALDMQQKKLQIAKLQKELSGGGVEASEEQALNTLAYANQYAATGQIPTGLPKGTFGIVAQTAKELPKATGFIANATTGVADSKTPATEQADYGRLYNITKNVNRLKDLDQKRIGGIISGTLGAVFGSQDQANYLAVRKAIVDDLQRMQSGAALTPEESAYYSDYLPGRFSEPGGLGVDSMVKINNFSQLMNDRLQDRLSNNGLAIYGYSKVKTPVGDLTVGDTVTSATGQQGRVNADGTITLIQ